MVAPTGGAGERGFDMKSIYQRLIEFTRDGVYRYRFSDGTILMANQSLIDILDLDMTQKEIVGKPLRELMVYTEEEGTVRKALEESGEIHGFEYHFKTLRGDDRWVIHDSFVTNDPHTGERVVEAIVKDITDRVLEEEERRAFETKLQQTQKLESLGILAGGIAHDFNNLLTGILGNTELAIDDLDPHAPARDCLRDIETTAKRAADLCRQLLAYSGKGRFVIEPIDLNHEIREMTHLLEVSISKAAVLKFDLRDRLPAIEADASQIRQVIMNLVLNASEAVGNRYGVINISSGVMDCDEAYHDSAYLTAPLKEGRYVYIEVSDTGCGIDAETRRKLFDPFFTTKTNGRGLGLAAVLGIVRGQQGTIKVYSEPGKGSTFKVLFPVTGKSAKASKPKVRPRAFPDFHGTILLVDDEPMVLQVGRHMLTRLGFSVLTASGGREALERFRQHRNEIICILLDLSMPHMHGKEVFRELRRMRDDVPIIVCSGYSEYDTSAEFAGKGMAGFLQKPYSKSDLAAKLKEVLIQDHDTAK